MNSEKGVDMSVATSENTQYFSPKEMMAEAEKFALSKANKTSAMTLGLAIMAGAFIGLAFLFYITVTTGSSSAGWGLSRLAGGLAFSMGLILIVICGGSYSPVRFYQASLGQIDRSALAKCSLFGEKCMSATLSARCSCCCW